MTAQITVAAADLWSIAGWTMVHFLWMGALVGAAAGVCRLLLRRASEDVRYASMIAWLLALAVLPIGTAAWLVRYSSPLEVGASGATVAAVMSTTSAPISIPSTNETAESIIELHIPNDAAELAAADRPSVPAAIADSSIANLAPNPPSSFWLSTLDPRLSTLTAFIPYLPWLWLIGTPVTFALLLTGIVGTRRLGRASQSIADGPIAEMLGRLAASLKITRRVTVAVCERIAAPVLIGIVRPMILLPPAALTGWSPDEIEMVLLHELAHVRRWDNLVNLLQRCIESLLFFHPAVWMISTWVRREREACCDTIVVGRTNRPHAYAEMLVALAAQMPRSVLFHPAASSAMAAGPLRSRIRRILQLEDDPMLVSGKSLILVLGSLLVAATLAVVYVPAIGNAEEAAAENLEGMDNEAVEEKTLAAEENRTEQARQEKDSLNNMRRIALAILNYEAAHGTLPPQAICDANGRPLLSWRVLILPYLEPYDGEAALVNEFHQDEPWDSEHNRKLITRMPAAFTNPMLKEPGKTNYLAVVGRECVFNGSPVGLSFRAISDGTSKTIDVVEANADQAVEWTKPEDWNFDRNNPLRGLGSAWPDGWHAAYADGHIKKLARDASPDAVGIAFTRNGREQKSLAESAKRGFGREGAMVGMEGEGLRYGVPGAEGGAVTAVDPLGPPRAVTQPVNNNPFAGPPGAAPPAGNPFAGQPEGEYGLSPHDFRPVADAAERRRFPSLEEQKLADLAYKRLGLELEAIGEEELKRVRALGFDGGVKVTDTNGPLQPTDILVGLHVWPTTSIKQVADIMSREDLAELTPLKYYVVRQELASSPQHPNGVVKDFVRSGRIPVQLDRTPRRGWGGESSYNVPATPQRPPTGAMPARDSTAPTRPEEASPYERISRPSDSKRSATVAPTRLATSAQDDRYAAPPAPPLTTPAAAINPTPLANAAELEVLRERVKIVSEQFKNTEALWKTGSRGGSTETYYSTGYELALAEGELALAEGKRDIAIEKFQLARSRAEEALKANQAAYSDGRITYDIVLSASKNLADVKLKLIRLQGTSYTEPPAAIRTTNAPEAVATKPRQLFAEVDGEVQQVLVEHGDLVKKGQVLLVLRSPGLEHDIATVNGEYNKNLAKHESTSRELSSNNALTEAERSQRQRDIQKLSATLESLRKQRALLLEKQGKLQIRSPIDGRVVTWNVHDQLFNRPVRRGEKLLEVAGSISDWEPEVQMPEKRESPKSLAPPVARGNTYAAGDPATGTASPHSTKMPAATPAQPSAAQYQVLDGKSNLRYDGKTFETWRDTWKTELSTEKRLEAIKALAAFGRAGYGKEATETILEVAAEYDFKILEGNENPEGKLKETVIEELAPEYRTQSLAPYWLPDLAARLKKDPAKWKWLTYWVVSKLRSSDAAMRGILQEMAVHDDTDVKTAALDALLRTAASGDSQLDDKTRKLVNDALGSKDPSWALRRIVQLLVYTPPATGDGKTPRRKLLYRPPGLALLLLRSEPEVRLDARAMVPLIDEKDAPELVNELVDALKDPSRDTEHIAAMRALALMGPKAAKAFPALFDVLKKSKNQETFAAAIVALVRIADEPSQVSNGGFTTFNLAAFTDILKARLNEEDQLAMHKKLQGTGGDYVQKFTERLKQEDDDLLPPPNQGFSGGGGGFF